MPTPVYCDPSGLRLNRAVRVQPEPDGKAPIWPSGWVTLLLVSVRTIPDVPFATEKVEPLEFQVVVSPVPDCVGVVLNTPLKSPPPPPPLITPVGMHHHETLFPTSSAFNVRGLVV